MATPDIFNTEEDLFRYASISDPIKGETTKSRGSLIEKKIEFLENLTSRVSNRRTRRWVNDRILMELVPRLNAEEVRGDDAPVSAFCMTNAGEWDKFRNIDMDKEANIMKGLKNTSSKRISNVDSDKSAALGAWYRIDLRTREALRRSFLSDLIEGYEKCVRAFIREDGGEEVLVFRVQDPFHRLLLHGVCEFYNLTSMTETRTEGSQSVKMTKIKKKKSGSAELPNITLSHFLKMSKDGIW
ncbi:hypothetical protein V2J09_009237 [Rumex salicifolius]